MKTKVCPQCNEEKTLDCFYKKRANSNPELKNCSSYCKPCNKVAAAKYKASEHYKAHKEKYLDRNYRKQYGVTFVEYEQMKEDQNNACIICGREGDLCLDHNHQTGKARAFLCRKCNMAISVIEDKLYFQSIVQYLEDYDE